MLISENPLSDDDSKDSPLVEAELKYTGAVHLNSVYINTLFFAT